MLAVESALKGSVVEANDGSIGSVPDCLFDQRNWKLRWLVVDSEAQVLDRPGSEYRTGLGGGDPNLRSMAAIKGYHVEATDGSIGHIKNFIIDDVSCDVRYLIVDAKNWWVGQIVLMSPFAVRHISWIEQNVLLDVSRDRVKNSPPWRPLDPIDKSYQERLH